MLDRNMGRTKSTDPTAVAFGARVRARRQELRLTQEQLAERSGLHFTYVSSVERGERNVTLRTIFRLAEALDTEPAVLMMKLS